MHRRPLGERTLLPRSGRAATALMSRAGRRYFRKVQELFDGLALSARLAPQARRAYCGGR